MEGVSAMGIEMARILEGASEEVREIGMAALGLLTAKDFGLRLEREFGVGKYRSSWTSSECLAPVQSKRGRSKGALGAVVLLDAAQGPILITRKLRHPPLPVRNGLQAAVRMVGVAHGDRVCGRLCPVLHRLQEAVRVIRVNGLIAVLVREPGESALQVIGITQGVSAIAGRNKVTGDVVFVLQGAHGVGLFPELTALRVVGVGDDAAVEAIGV